MSKKTGSNNSRRGFIKNTAVIAGGPKANGKGFDYPGSNITFLWDNENMRVTNFDEVNQFVKREYRQGWTLGV